jgi:hypothetical protein
MAALQLGVNLLGLYDNYYIVVSEFELLWQVRWPLGASGALREILAIVTDEFAFGYSGIGHLGTGHLRILLDRKMEQPNKDRETEHNIFRIRNRKKILIYRKVGQFVTVFWIRIRMEPHQTER